MKRLAKNLRHKLLRFILFGIGRSRLLSPEHLQEQVFGCSVKDLSDFSVRYLVRCFVLSNTDPTQTTFFLTDTPAVGNGLAFLAF